MTEDSTFSSRLIEAVQLDARQLLGQLRERAYDGLYEMVAHHFGWEDGRPGKAVRPLLCLLTCSAAGGDWKTAIPAATGIELIHNFSLIHDDIEDGSELRRHRPTVWRLWGLPQAINTGDALYALARLSGYRMLERGCDPSTVLRVQRLLDETCLNLTMGQYLDLGFDASQPGVLDRYLKMIENKTASLVAASAAVGAICAGASESTIRDFQAYGLHLGLAFQILDDVLGTWGSEGSVGKPVGADVDTRKPSYPPMYALESSSEFDGLWRDLEASTAEILAALEKLGAQAAAQRAAEGQTRLAVESLAAANPLEPAASELRALTDRLLVRES